MTFGRIARIALLTSLTVLLFAFIASSGGHPSATVHPQPGSSEAHCTPIAGTVTTNLEVVN